MTQETYWASLSCGHEVTIPSRHQGSYGLGASWMCRGCTGLRAIAACEGEEYVAESVAAHLAALGADNANSDRGADA